MKIAQDPDTGGALSLADTLAKATFGDPEGQMKARALASEVGVRMASRDKLLADTGLVQAKTRSEKDAEDAILAAGPAIGEAGAAAVPMPVPVEASRTNAPGTTGYGPQPGIVSQHDLDVHNTLVARERALGLILARGTPDQVAKGVNENYGGTILSAAAANPAIVSGDSLRIAGGLSTGTAPSTSTVWGAGDTSGVDAAAREHILEKQAESTLPEKPHDVTYRGQPGQTYRDANGNLVYTGATGTETTPEKPDIIDLPGGGKGTLIRDAQGNPTGVQTLPGAEGRPEKQEIIDLPSGGKGAVIRDAQGNVLGTIPIPGAGAFPKLETVGKDTAQRNPDGSLSVPDVIGRPPAVVAGPYDDLNSAEGRNNKIIRDAMTLASQPVDPLRPSAITPQIARDYDQAFIEKFGAKTTVQKLPNTDPAKGPLGVPVDTPVTEYPSIPNFLSPAEMYKRAGVSPPPAQPPGPPSPIIPPVAGPNGQSPAPVPAPNPLSNATVVGAPTGPVQTPTPNDSQSKDRRFAGSAAFANKPLDKFTPDQIPGVVASMLAIPKVSGSGFLASLGRANLPEKDKEWARNALEFTAAVNYEQSGAAVNADEWENAKQIYIPMPGDKPKQLADKRAARRNWMENAAKSGWSNDPKGLQDFMASLDQPDSGGGGGPAPSNDNAPAKAPQAMKDAWSHMTPDAKARATARYGQ